MKLQRSTLGEYCSVQMEHFLEVLKILDGAANADRGKVTAYAEQLASKLDASGDKRAAASIRSTLNKGKALDLAPSRLSQSLPVDGESRFALADERRYLRGEVCVVLDEPTAARISEFIRHVNASDELLASGVGIAPSLLVHGPPGCGKTELAKHLAAELQLPLLTARTDALISSYLGSTAKNLRVLFEHAMARPCVLFLDEFDAVAKLRDDQHELGELKRVVVSLLQNIDALDNKTVLVAATNHEHLLDRAIWRRFAFKLDMKLPAIAARESLFRQFLSTHAPSSLNLKQLAAATEGMSGADIRHLCEEARRGAILNRQTTIPDDDLLLRLARIRVPGFDSMQLRERVAAARRISRKLYKVRPLSKMFSVSIGTISKLLPSREDA